MLKRLNFDPGGEKLISLLNHFHDSTVETKKKKKSFYEAVGIFVAGVHPLTDSTNSSDWEKKNVVNCKGW